MKTVGVLALQGAFKEHVAKIRALGHHAVEIRTVENLKGLDGLILPGGESTAIGKLMRDLALLDALVEAIEDGLPVWGTCAGMILLARRIESDPTTHLAVMDIGVKRNAYGRQVSSFIVNEVIFAVSTEPLPLVFIRAPYIVEVGRRVEVLHRLGGHIVAAKEKNMLVTSFHPELTESLTWHDFFINRVMH